MTWVEQSRALRASLPSPDGIARLAAALGEPVTARRALHGGVASSTWEVSTPTRRLVLKRFRVDEDGSSGCSLEWDRLEVARHAPVPSPVPVAVDLEGGWFGTPALVMSHLPGSVAFPPPVEALARTLAALHTTPIPDPVPAVLLRPGFWTRWVQTEPVPDGVLDAMGALPAIAAQAEPVLVHYDFHPGNVLVEDGVVTGVIDWAGARLGPRAFDVALARCDLAIEPGGDAPARFLRAYEVASGVGLEHLREWDCLAAARAIENGHGWVDAWTDSGVDMSAERITERATEFAVRALS